MAIVFFSNDSSSESARAALQKRLPELKVYGFDDLDASSRAEIRYAVAWNPPTDFFQGLDNLQAILSMGAGVDHLLDHPELPRHLPLARLEDAGMGEKIAEYVLYGVLHAQRSFDVYREKQHSRIWDSADRDQHAENTTIGILGLGAIGQVVAKRLLLNHYKVSSWSRSVKSMEGVTSFAGQSQLGDFLAKLDVLVCLLPLTPETEGMLDRQFLQQLPRGAFLINAARGRHVDSAGLLEVLESGHLRGALLDVTDPEPLPEDNLLWNTPQVLITPHIAGPTQLSDSIDQIAANIRRMEDGQQPTGLVEYERGY